MNWYKISKITEEEKESLLEALDQKSKEEQKRIIKERISAIGWGITTIATILGSILFFSHDPNTKKAVQEVVEDEQNKKLEEKFKYVVKNFPPTNSQQPPTDSQQPPTDSQQPQTDSQQPQTDSQQPQTDSNKPEVNQDEFVNEVGDFIHSGEGFETTFYPDPALEDEEKGTGWKKPTIGYGFNVADNSIARKALREMGYPVDKMLALPFYERKDFLYNNPIVINEKQGKEILNRLSQYYINATSREIDDFYSHPVEVQKILVDMYFNMGGIDFPNFKKAIKDKRYRDAAYELLFRNPDAWPWPKRHIDLNELPHRGDKYLIKKYRKQVTPYLKQTKLRAIRNAIQLYNIN